ncbi:MAG: hypothetical protein MK101_00425 [Phycisphaerales bacterium]|nr:hypothetical protein [Phycisphaerales bacterium]
MQSLRRPVAPPVATQADRDVDGSMAAHISAQAARSRGDHRGAMAAWRDAVLLDQANAAAWRGIALSSEAMGQRDAAASAWKRRLDLVPDDARAQGVIGERLVLGGEFEPGAALLLNCRGRDYEACLEDSTLAWTRDLLLIGALEELGHLEGASELRAEFSAALPAAAIIDEATDRNDARWLFLMQRAAQVGVLRPCVEAAIARAQHADEREPDRRGVERARARASAARFFAAALVMQAKMGVDADEVLALLEAGQRDGHIRLSPFIRSETPVSEALWRTGVIALQLRNDQLAHDLLQRALTLAPADGRIHNAIGWLLLERSGPTDTVVEHLEAAVELAPDDPAVLDSIGVLRLRQGKPAEAIPLLMQAREIAAQADPVRDGAGDQVEDPEILTHLGDAHAAAGNQAEARILWTRALEQLTGDIGRWRLARQAPMQRRDWGLEVMRAEDLYDLRFAQLERDLRTRLSGEFAPGVSNPEE